MKHVIAQLLGGVVFLAVGVPNAYGSESPCATEPTSQQVANCVATALAHAWGQDELSGVLGVRIEDTEAFVVFGDAGDAETEALTPGTLFRIASMTKPVTAAVALSLVASSELVLEDDVRHFLPELPEPEAGSLRIWHLIEHRSGLPPLEGSLDVELSDIEFQDDPGTRIRYSNLNYFLLGLVIERATRRSLEEMIWERIPPLRGEFFLDRAPVSRATAKGMVPGLWGWWPAEEVLSPAVFRHTEGKGARGGLASPAAMLEFVSELFSGRLPGLQDIPAAIERGAAEEIGWARFDRFLWHNGVLTPYGWQSMMVWDRDEAMAVVLLSNRDEAFGRLDEALIEALDTGRASRPRQEWGVRALVILLGTRVIAVVAGLMLLVVVSSQRRELSLSVSFGLLLAAAFALHDWWIPVIAVSPGIIVAIVRLRKRSDAGKVG